VQVSFEAPNRLADDIVESLAIQVTAEDEFAVIAAQADVVESTGQVLADASGYGRSWICRSPCL